MLTVQYCLAYNLLFYTLPTRVVPTTIFYLCYCANSRSEKKRTSYTMLAFGNCAPSISFHAKQILRAYFKYLFIYLQISYNKLKCHESFRVIFSLCYICIFTYYSTNIIQYFHFYTHAHQKLLVFLKSVKVSSLCLQYIYIWCTMLSKTFSNFIGYMILRQKRIFHTYAIAPIFNYQQYHLCQNNLYLQRKPNCITQKRWKNKKTENYVGILLIFNIILEKELHLPLDVNTYVFRKMMTAKTKKVKTK